MHREIGIEENAALAYLSDGRRLRTDNVRDLAGAQDQVRPLLRLFLCFSHPIRVYFHMCMYDFRVALWSFLNPAFSPFLPASNRALVHICVQQILFGRGFR